MVPCCRACVQGRHDRGLKVIRLVRFALDGDSQIDFVRRFVCSSANENGDSHWEWPSPFEHRNERMNSMIFEALLAAITLWVTGRFSFVGRLGVGDDPADLRSGNGPTLGGEGHRAANQGGSSSTPSQRRSSRP
jgi:hypothetical protein